MFVENSMLNFIEADSQDVVAMYRSSSTVMLALGRRQRQPCEAFICVTNDGDSAFVHVALSLLNSKSCVVYVPEKQPDAKVTTDQLLKEAQDFVKEFGFEMQRINLDYSKALKEVVLNDLRVVRSATAGKKTSQRKSAAEKISRQQHDAAEKTTEPEDGSSEKVRTADLEQEKKAAKEELDASLVQEGGRDLSELKSMPAQDRALLDEQQRKEQLLAEKESAENETSQTLALLRADNKRLEKELAAFEGKSKTEVAALQAEVAELERRKTAAELQGEKEIAKLEKESQRLSQQVATQEKSAEDKLSALAAEIEKLSQVKKAAEKDASGKIAEAKAEIDLLKAAQAEYSTVTAAELQALHVELEPLNAAKMNAEMERVRELAVLKSELDGLLFQGDTDQELIALKDELERRRAEKSAMDNDFQSVMSGLQVQRAALDEEIQTLELRRRDELSKFQAELEEATREKQRLSEELEQKLISLREENERLRNENKIAELKVNIETLTAEKISLEAKNAKEIAALTTQEEQLARQLVADEAAAAEELAAAQARLVTMQSEIKKKSTAAKEALAKVTTEIEKLENEGSVRASETSAQMTSLKARMLQFADDLLLTEKQAAEKTQEARKTVVALIAALSGDEKPFGASAADPDVESWLVSLQKEADQLQLEKSALENTSTEELAMLRAKVTSLAVEKAAIEKNLAREMDALQVEADRLAAEKTAAEKAAKKVLADISVEVARLLKEKAAAEKVLEESIASADTATRKLIDEKAELEERLVQHSMVHEEIHAESVELSGKISVPAAVADTKKAESVSPPGQPSLGKKYLLPVDDGDEQVDTATVFSSSDDTDPFAFLQQEGAFEFGIQPKHGRKSSSIPVTFSLDKSKIRLDYQRPEDVVEIYKSLNRTRVSRDDNTTVTCDAYVFSLREEGLPHVYIAFCLVDSQESMVYVPEKQPENEEELGTIMSDCFDFIEIVGFMMDPMDLGDNSKSRITKLEKIPVLQRITSAAG